MRAAIRAIEYYVPAKTLTNVELSESFPEWSAEKIVKKTGIELRHVADENQLASDLGVNAAHKLFESGVIEPRNVDFLLFCTQSPDYFLPTTACIVQDRLGLPISTGALDFNLGCSGFVYGLGLAKGLIETDQAANVLLITAETYSKFIDPRDKSNKVLFGDAAAATLISSVNTDRHEAIGPFVWGTDGAGGMNLIVKEGGMRQPLGLGSAAKSTLYMNGPEIFSFTLRVVPPIINRLLEKAHVSFNDVDFFVFHQANEYMLEHLRTKMKIPREKFVLHMRDCGNTVSSTIPIALKEHDNCGRLFSGAKIVLVGFGVGYSWSASMIRWDA